MTEPENCKFKKYTTGNGEIMEKRSKCARRERIWTVSEWHFGNFPEIESQIHLRRLRAGDGRILKWVSIGFHQMTDQRFVGGVEFELNLARSYFLGAVREGHIAYLVDPSLFIERGRNCKERNPIRPQTNRDVLSSNLRAPFALPYSQSQSIARRLALALSHWWLCPFPLPICLWDSVGFVSFGLCRRVDSDYWEESSLESCQNEANFGDYGIKVSY